MEPLTEIDALYDEIHAHYAPRDPELVRRRAVAQALNSRVVLLGQALGRDTQRLSGLPFCFPPPERPILSRGGQVLNGFLASVGYTILPDGRGQYAYHTDLAHYFPGRHERGSGDVRPPAEEVARNRRWLETEVRLIKPAIVIALGQQPAAVFLERYGGQRVKRLLDVAAVPFPCRVGGVEVQLIAVHHPSGAFQHPSSRETYERAATQVRRILESQLSSAAHGLRRSWTSKIEVTPAANAPPRQGGTMAVAPDRLLGEIDRQQKYLDKLPETFEFPLFNARQALESQRSSGYRSTAAASREIVDNSYEAGADFVHVIFDSARNGRGQKIVSNVAFIDNGSGMLPKMARYALTWGGGTHFDDPSFIGKFGFGLPNSSINQTRRVEVYTRTGGSDPFTRAYLDIREFSEYGVQEIPDTEAAELPPFVQQYLERNQIDLEHGTVVVWVNPDKLTYRRPGTLKEHLLDDFGATYRYLLRSDDKPDGLELVVEGVPVEPVDPLFTLSTGRYYLPPEEDGAIVIQDRFLPVVYYEDADTGERHLRLVKDEAELADEEEGRLAAGAINVRIVRFPLGFADDKGPRGDESEAKKRFEIRKTRRGMAFVRAGREIQTLESFPRSARDVANKMGRWPLLQSYAYHWGVEVRFKPELDEVFGITNDKQGVRPVEDFWRVLAEAEIDTAVREENKWQSDQRRKKPQAAPPTGPSAAERAAYEADVASGTSLRVPPFFLVEARKQLEVEAKRRAGAGATSLEDARQALEQESKRRPYRIEYFEAPYGPFFEPLWIGSQIVVRINKGHPFYETLYEELLGLAGGTRAKEAVDLLLIVLAKAELTAESDEMALWYQAQRRHVWSAFLETAMKSLGQKLETPEERAEEEAAENGNRDADVEAREKDSVEAA